MPDLPSTLIWVGLALVAALLTSFNPILYKRLVKESGPVVTVWGRDRLGVAVAGTVEPGVDTGLASVQSLRLADASLVAPLLTFTPLFTLLIALVFLGEVPNAR